VTGNLKNFAKFFGTKQGLGRVPTASAPPLAARQSPVWRCPRLRLLRIPTAAQCSSLLPGRSQPPPSVPREAEAPAGRCRRCPCLGITSSLTPGPPRRHRRSSDPATTNRHSKPFIRPYPQSLQAAPIGSR